MSKEAIYQLTEFFKSYPEQCFDRGHLLYQPGDELQNIVYLESGTIDQYAISNSGEEVIIDTSSPGDFLPKSNLLEDTPLDFFFQAKSKIIARAVPFHDIKFFIRNNPRVALYLLKAALSRERRNTKRLSHQLGGNALSQILFEIIDRAEKASEKQIGGNLKLQINESDLAKLTGLSRETVNRNLNRFKKMAVVKSSATGLVISDLPLLKNELESIL